MKNNPKNGPSQTDLKNMFFGPGRTAQNPGGANQAWGDDAKKLFVEFAIPPLVKFVVDRIPDITYEQFVLNYQKIWDAVLPGFSFAILRAFNAPEIVDELTTEILASVKVAMDDRTDDMKERNDPAKKTNVAGPRKSAPIKDLLGSLAPTDFANFLNLANSLDDEQRSILMSTYLDLNQRDAVAVLKNASGVTEQIFKLWVNGVAPKPKAKVPTPDTKIEKFVKDGLTDFGTDAKTFLGKKSWLEQLAENVKK